MIRLLVVFSSCFVLTLIMGTCQTSSGPTGFPILKDGILHAELVLPDEEQGYLTTALSDWQYYWSQATGKSMEFMAESSWEARFTDIQGESNSDTLYIFIGPTRLASSTMESLASMHEGAIYIQTRWENIPKLILTGKGAQGVSNALYTFLEDVFGVRWYAPIEPYIYIPQYTEFTIPSLDIQYDPPLKHRGLVYGSAIPSQSQNPNSPELALYSGWHASMRLGGNQAYFASVMNLWIPPDTYGESDPQFYALLDGKRNTGDVVGSWQPCFSNTKLRQVLIEKIKTHLELYPEEQMVPLSPNQTSPELWCQCKACAALGNRTDQLIHFANSIATAFETTHPHVYFGVHAFDYLATPPQKQRVHSHVVVMLDPEGADTVRSMFDPDNPDYPKEKELWEAWDAVCDTDNLLKRDWGYQKGRQLPFFTLNKIATDLPYLASHHFYGYQAPIQWNWAIQGVVYYITASLLWDPTQDVDLLLEEYCTDLFGPYSADVRAYYDVLIRAVDEARMAITDRKSADELQAIYTEEILSDLEYRILPIQDAYERERNANLRTRLYHLLLSYSWLEAQLNFLIDRAALIKKPTEDPAVLNQAVQSTEAMVAVMKEFLQEKAFRQVYRLLEIDLQRTIYPYILKLRSENVFVRTYYYKTLQLLTEADLPFHPEAGEITREAQITAWMDWWKASDPKSLIFPSMRKTIE